MRPIYDAMIIGGGPAGLSAALSLGRMGRPTLVLDDKRPRNQASSHLNNFPTRDGIHPADWRELARRDLAKYETVEIFEGSVLAVEPQDHGFRAELTTGESIESRKLILAAGIEDRLPDAPGFRQLWGKAVFHCPYCHGYEVRGKKLGLIASGFAASHMTPMIYGLSKDLVLFTNGAQDFPQEMKQSLKQNKLTLIEDKIIELIHEGDSLKAVALDGGRFIEREALFAAPVPPFRLKTDIGERLGCEKTEMGLYKIGLRGDTSVKGVFAAGDSITMFHSVVHACSSGQMAGAAAASELLAEDFSG